MTRTTSLLIFFLVLAATLAADLLLLAASPTSRQIDRAGHVDDARDAAPPPTLAVPAMPVTTLAPIVIAAERPIARGASPPEPRASPPVSAAGAMRCGAWLELTQGPIDQRVRTCVVTKR